MCPDDNLEVEVETADSQPADLKAVVALATRLRALEDEILELENQLKTKQAAHRVICEGELVTAILETGLRAVPLIDGTMIEVVTAYHASITEANKSAAHDWLRGIGRGDYIKKAVSVQFGQGEEKLATAAVQWLRTQYPEHKIEDKEAVHASMLKAFVTREMTNNNTVGIPEDLFSLHTRRYAAVTKTTTKQLKKGGASSEF